MQNSMRNAANAYAASAAHRSLRQQEADVFRHANARLRHSRGEAEQTRAIADNRLLWLTVMDLMKDPTNRLPVDLRASILSVGMAVQREMESPAPNVEFLIGINEDIAAGLAS
jgi:flagellar biosynthesis regulator FlaF